MNRRASGITLQQLLLVIVLVALVLGVTMSVVHGPLARRGQKTRVEHLAFSPDGRTLAAGSWNGTLRLWDLSQGKIRATYVLPSGSMAFTPDGKTLALGCWDGTIQLWDVEGERERAVLGGHLAPPIRREDDSLYAPWRGVEALAFDPDGKIMATGSGDGTAKLWDLSSGE